MSEAATARHFDPARLLGALDQGGVDFVVVGGIAAALHGSRRITDDLDVAYSTEPKNLKALGDALVGLNAKLAGIEEDLPFIADEGTLPNVSPLMLETDAGRLDVMVRPDGCPRYEALRAQAEMFEIDAISVLVASIDDLIAMKVSADRDQDRADVATLEAIRQVRLRGE